MAWGRLITTALWVAWVKSFFLEQSVALVKSFLLEQSVAWVKLKHLAVKVGLVVVNIKFLLVVKKSVVVTLSFLWNHPYGGCNCKVPFGITHTAVGKVKALSVV